MWRRDPRFTDLLPTTDETIDVIATTGRHNDQRDLLAALPKLRRRVDQIASQPPLEALRDLSQAVARLEDPTRIEPLLRVLGLTESPPITQAEAARIAGVSFPRIQQQLDQLTAALRRAKPPTGYWLPSLATLRADRIDLRSERLQSLRDTISSADQPRMRTC